MLNLPKKVLCYDLETGGLSSQYDPITQIGAVVMEGDDVVGIPFSQLMSPADVSKFKISAGALSAQAGDIKTPEGRAKALDWLERIATSPNQKESAVSFISWATEHSAADLPTVAHNASFDAGFMASWAHQQRTTFGTLPFGAISICTMQLMKKLAPGGKHYNLDACLLVAGLPARPSDHNALQDAILAGRLYHFARTELIKRGLAN